MDDYYQDQPADDLAPEQPTERPRWQPRLVPDWEKTQRAIWTLGSSLSLILNIVLIVTVLILSRQLFTLKTIVNDHLIAGLYYNFILMDQAHIETDVIVDDTIPVVFDLPLQQETVVVLTQATTINGATVSLSTGGLNIVNAPTNIVLPAGTRLPVRLSMTVPVDTTIPVQLNVPVDIALSETDLHEPFLGLQDVVSPLYDLIDPLPNSWPEALCAMFNYNCP